MTKNDTSAQTAWREWILSPKARKEIPDVEVSHEVAFKAGYVQALLDAADELENDVAGWVRSMGPSEADAGTLHAVDQLRARAADAGGNNNE